MRTGRSLTFPVRSGFQAVARPVPEVDSCARWRRDCPPIAVKSPPTKISFPEADRTSVYAAKPVSAGFQVVSKVPVARSTRPSPFRPDAPIR